MWDGVSASVCVKESQLLQWSRSDGKDKERGEGGRLELPNKLLLLDRSAADEER